MAALSEEQKKLLKSAFEDIDLENTGQICKSDIRSALQLIGQNPTSEEMMPCSDKKVQDQLNLDEFYDFIERNIRIKTQEQIDKELSQAFDKFKDGADVYISKEEFRKIMTKLGDEPLTENEANILTENLTNFEHDEMYNTKEIAELFMG